MNKLFITTALFSLGSFTATATVPATDSPLTEADFSAMQESLATTSIAVGLHRGDFQASTRTAKTHLYKGDGSSLMGTVRRYRD